jgi:hypothetical protein
MQERTGMFGQGVRHTSPVAPMPRMGLYENMIFPFNINPLCNHVFVRAIHESEA